MDHPIRVMLVDDSVVVRRLLSEALAKHPEVKVVATAANGLLALSKLAVQAVDVVVLDMEMPEMDGLTMLKQLRVTQPRLPVIMFSTLTERGAYATIDALAAGANDYVLKPSTASGETLDVVVGQILVPKLLSLAHSRAARSIPVKLELPRARSWSSERLPPLSREPVRLIVIAASTGGPNALIEVLTHLPGALSVPVLVTQHMPPTFTRAFAERLDQRCELAVLESSGGELLRAGHVYIAPGNRHLELVRDGADVRTALSDAPSENSCRPSADVMFRAAARLYGSTVLAIVLTGMGQDGMRGAQSIHAAGGRVLAQSGPTCVVWGMPKAVEEAGLADAVVPLPEIASAIMLRVGNGLTPSRTLAEV